MDEKPPFYIKWLLVSHLRDIHLCPEMYAVAKMLNLAILAGENVNDITKGILESGESDKYKVWMPNVIP